VEFPNRNLEFEFENWLFVIESASCCESGGSGEKIGRNGMVIMSKDLSDGSEEQIDWKCCLYGCIYREALGFVN
jgi:hypothetical protein